MRIICFGAHPDDCEIKFGGTAAKFAAAGHAVKFVSVTNGAGGHYEKFGPGLVEIRRRESEEAAKRLRIAESANLGRPDGGLQPDLETRRDVIRQIRNWNADVVLSPRMNDYHPDHRYTAQLVQDAAYMVVVPGICPDAPTLRKNPVILHLEDDFQLPNPLRPDVAVDIDEVWRTKVMGMDAHVSQFYEWLPWVDGKSNDVPSGGEARRNWLSETWSHPINDAVRAALVARYGEKGRSVKHAEAFELCEYGRQATKSELDKIFPR
ncbi:MAG TPA: PIG-L family deacetylase [Candidatus Acidoferrales bacterium]|nr:PIG-L family deacetylase [Candidatus Acidoferrales bacterium]